MLTSEHLDRLADLGLPGPEAFARPAGCPEYRQRRLVALLAQGAARHYLDCLTGQDPGSRTGVKDLDVWTFYTAIPGTAFPAARRETHADFARHPWAASPTTSPPRAPPASRPSGAGGPPTTAAASTP